MTNITLSITVVKAFFVKLFCSFLGEKLKGT